MNKRIRKIFIFSLLCIFIVLGLTACGKDGVKVKSANALARKLTNSSTAKINVTEELALEEPIVITGEKEIVGEGTITAAMKGSEEVYMITVAEGGKLTIGGSVKIDAASLMGAVHVQDGGSVVVKGKAVVKNASEAAANALVEGSLEVKGGNLKDAKGHNIINKNITTISGGKVTGSGDKYAGIYNEATLTQNGGKVSTAYNNISNLKGSTFTFEGGTNENSIRDGVFVAEGATLKATNKDATIVNAGARGILLQGQADIKVITVKECGDSLVKVTKTGVLNLGNGVLQGGNYHGVDNAGSMNMLGGNISLNANCGIVNTGTLKVTSGNISENANKGILNKHKGKADVTSPMVTLTSNKTAIANEDKAVFEFAKAKLLMSTQTNIYCYDGTMNIHDASLNASTSNNVRIVDGVINMTNVEVKGNSQKSNTSHHGIYMEGGIINAENVTVSMTTGHGIRNKGGVFKGKNIIMHDINRVAVSQGKHDYLEDAEGLTEIDGLEVQSTNYSNIWNEGGGTVKITNAKLAVASSNSVRSNDGKMELTNVTIPGHKEGSKNNIHGIYLEGGEIVAKNVVISNTSGNAIRNKNGKFIGTKINISNVKGDTAIANLPLDDDNKNGIVNIDGLTIKKSSGKNITLDSGVTTIKNATLGAAPANNIKLQNNAATLNLYNVKVEGQIEDATANTHGIMVEGGNVYGDNVQIYDTNACGIRCKMGVVDLKNVTMTNLGQAGISNSKMTKDGVVQGVGDVTIDGLTLTKAGTNNVVLDAGTVTIKNGVLGKVETNNHNTKVSGTGVLTMKNVKVEGTSNSSKYGIIAEGGDAILEDVQIYDLARSGIHANKATSEVTGKNITISNGVFGVTGSNGSITIDGLTTSNISDNNVLADNLLKVTLKNSTLGETTGHNVKATGDAIVSLKKTEILGVTDGSKHGVMAEGGDVNLTDVTISNVKNTAIRINKATSKVTGENVTITNSGNGVTGTNGKVVINGLTTTGIAGNNVVSDGGANFTIKNGDLCQVTGDAHNVKVTGSSNLKITDTVVRGTTSDSKYGIIAEGGDAVLKNVEIYDVAKSAIHTNKETSKVTGENITIANGVQGITGSAGIIELKKVKTSGLSDNNISIGGTCVVTVTKSTGGYGLGVTNGHSVKVVDDAIVNLDTVEIEGVTATDRHGVMAEGGDVVLNNVLIHDVANSAIRINKPTSEVTGTKVVIKDSNNAVSGSDGTVTIDGLTTSGISNNNVLVSGSSDEAGCVVTVTNGILGWTAGHNVKAETYGKVYLKDTELNGVVSAGKYGVMAEGGYANLDNVKIKAVTEAAIRSNKDTSVVEGTVVTITKSGVGVSVSAGNVTLNELKSTATTSNVTVSGGETIINNSTLSKTGDSNAVVSGGVLKLDDVDVNGTSANYGVLVTAGKLEVKPNVTVKDTAAEGVYNQGGTIEGDKLTIQNTGAAALHNANGGKTTLTNLNVSGSKSYNIWNEGENSSVTVDGGELAKSASNNVVVAGGKVTLKNLDVNGTGGSSSNNIHGVLASGGDVVLEKVTITGSATAAIRVNNANSKVEGTDVTFGTGYLGISANNGETIINGLKTSGLTQNNILASDSAQVTINAYANGDKSELGATTKSHNVKATPDALVTLNDVKVLGSTSSNAVMAEGGDFVLNNVDIEGAAKGTGIRINNTKSLVTGTNVTINGCNYGISYNGNIDITGLTCNATTANVEITGGTFNVKDATFGKTTGSNVLVKGGAITLEKATINGTSGTEDAYGIEVSKGTINLKGDIVLQDTKLEGIYNYGGTINGTEANSIKIKNTGSSAIKGEAGTTNLKGITITEVKKNNSILCSGTNTVITITGGTIEKTPSNSINISGGTVTLNDVDVKGTAALSSGNLHNVIISNGKLVLNGVDFSGADCASIRVTGASAEVAGSNVTMQGGEMGIWASEGSVVLDGLTTSDITANNIAAAGDSKVTINKYANGEKSVLGKTGGHNVKAEGENKDNLVTLNDVELKGSSSSAHYTIIAQGGDVSLNNVTMSGATAKAAMRINRASSSVTGTNVTITDAALGFTASAGEVNLTNLTSSATNTNVVTEGAKVTVTNGTLNSTSASNVKVTSGTLNLVGGSVNGSSGSYGIEVSGGTLNLTGDVTVKDTKLQGIYNHGGTINGSTANSLTIQNTGQSAILNETDADTKKASTTTLKNVAISGVKAGNNILNNGAESTLTIDGGEFQTAPTNNVKSASGTITLKNLTVNGTANVSHSVLAEGGDFVLENVTIQNSKNAGIRVNKAASTVTGTNVTIKNCASGITTNAGETTINGLNTSGITYNNILAETTGKVTINKYADGTKSVLGIAGGHNVKTLADGLITLNDVTLQGTSSKSHNIVMAEGGDFVLTNVDIVGNGTRTGIRANKTTSSVKGTNVAISNIGDGISNSGATFEMENLTITNVSGSYEFYNAGPLKLAGEINAAIHNDSAITVEAMKALNGDISVDWTNGKEPAVAIQFASAEDAQASRGYIKLGPVQYAKHELDYVNNMAIFATPIEVADEATLLSALETIASSQEKAGIIRLTGDFTITKTVQIPADCNVTIVDNGATRTLTRGASAKNLTIFNVPVNATLTLASSSRNNDAPSLIVDGGSESGVTNTAGCALFAVSGTATVEKGVKLANNISTGNNQGFGIYSNANSTTTFRGVMSNIKGTNPRTKGTAIIVKGLVTMEDAIVENCSAVLGGAIRVDKGEFKAYNSTFRGNSTNGNGGLFYVDLSNSKLTFEGCSFENNTATGSGGVIAMKLTDNVASKNNQITIDGCTFTNNTTNADGGAIFVEKVTDSSLIIKNTTFGGVDENNNSLGNSANGLGGAIAIAGSTKANVQIENCVFVKNTSGSNGGALSFFNTVDSNSIIESRFEQNVAANEGGAINMGTGAFLNLANCEFTNNSANRVSAADSKSGFGDVRVANNTTAGAIRISGKMIVDIYLNQAGKIIVNGPLTQGSQVIANWRIANPAKISGQTFEGIIFNNVADMEASSAYITQSANYSATYNLVFRDAKGILEKK